MTSSDRKSRLPSPVNGPSDPAILAKPNARAHNPGRRCRHASGVRQTLPELKDEISEEAIRLDAVYDALASLLIRFAQNGSIKDGKGPEK